MKCTRKACVRFLASLLLCAIGIPEGVADRERTDKSASAKESEFFEQQIATEELWALQPIVAAAIPKIKDVSWPRDDLDAFILKRLEEVGISPARRADRHALLRRVTFDLTGLPPTPEAIEAFVNDESDDAYEAVVDRLLGAPGFGDHWARHWFDLSCYADLADIQGNIVIHDAWRYRDYVIAAFNSDKPLDRFLHEQIAGDLLPYEDIDQQREQIIATGYLAIGPWTLQNYIKGQLAADVVDHQIDRIGRTFLGQTLSCARCHDHKFDPIPTRDYYALAGIFHSTLTTSHVGPGVWSAVNQVTLPDRETAPEELTRRKKRNEQLIAQRKQREAELGKLALQIPGTSTANILTLAVSLAANETDREYEVCFEAAPSVWARTEERTRASDGVQIDILRDDGSVLAGIRHSPGPWSGTKDAQKMHAASFTYRGDGSGNVQMRLASATPGSGRFAGALDDLEIRSDGEILFSENFEDLQPGKVAGAQVDTKLKVLAGARVPRWKGAGLNHTHAVDLGGGDYAVQLFGGNAPSLAAAAPITDAEKHDYARALELEQEVQRLDAEIVVIEQLNAPQKALAVRDVDEPSDSPIYRRGDFQSLGKIVPRGFLSAVTVSKEIDIPPDTSGRLQLAHWLTDPENRLTSRVLVNRIWHHLFGQGLVRSVDYFGLHGETPSHPELLDFLALRMRQEDRWSLKKTVRRMVLSSTYQMASTHNPRAAELDPENRFLWQRARRRLTAESIRDAMLAASGQLDPARGGPCLGLELKGNIRGAGGDVNPPTWGGTIPDHIKNRRSIYLPLKRERPGGDLEILSVFDFPHPSDITGARTITTVATQSLFLLNAPFVKRQATKLAERLIDETPEDERVRLDRLYLLTAGRPADAKDTEAANTFLDLCTRDFQGNRSAAWTELCHAMLSSNRFLFCE